MSFLTKCWSLAVIVVIQAWILAHPTSAQNATQEANDAVVSLNNEFWTWRQTEAPEYAYKFGVSPPVEGVVEEFTESAFQRRKRRAEELLDKVNEVQEDLLTRLNSMSLKILKNLLQSFIDGFKFRKFSAYNPVTPLGGPLRNWKNLLLWFKLESVEDYERLLTLYSRLPRQIEQMIRLMEKAITLGTTLHASSMTGVLKRLEDEEFVDARDSDFYQIFLSRPDTLPVQSRGRILTQAEESVRRAVIPTWQRLRSFIEHTYLQNTREKIGASSLPGGEEYYQQCLRWHLSVEMTPKEIYDIGVKEVNRILDLMKKIKEEEKFDGDVQAFLTHLKTQQENLYYSEEEILEACREVIRAAQGNLSLVLGTVPEAQVEVQKLDNPQGPTGRYSESSLDGSRIGVYWVNAYTPREKNDFPALTLHEAVPGHHTQSAFAIEQDLPLFRRAIEYRHYHAVPFNWAFHTSYSEGWALYAEYLGEDMGIYTDNLSLFGRYSSEIFRAVRLVVDTGIHAFGWSKERAIEYMGNYTLLPDQLIQNEINRYISWPGQATAYKIGELKIKELREKAQDKLGDWFDQRKFHDRVLMLGPAPLALLEEDIDEWIREEKAASGAALVTPTRLSVALVFFCLLPLMH